jgi:hypothetical protein
MKIILTDQHKIDPAQLKQDLHVVKNNVKFKAPPDTVILHYTAGSSAASSAAWLTDLTVKASAHVVIGKDGEIYQLVPFDTIAWHAGTSAYGGRTAFNNFSIGIVILLTILFKPFGLLFSWMLLWTYLVYSILMDAYREGTVGKLYMGLKVVNTQEGTSKLITSFYRNVMKLIIAMFLYDTLLLILRKGYSGFHNKIARTMVVESSSTAVNK